MQMRSQMLRHSCSSAGWVVFRLSRHCYRSCKSSVMLCSATGWVLPVASNEHSALKFRVNKSQKNSLASYCSLTDWPWSWMALWSFEMLGTACASTWIAIARQKTCVVLCCVVLFDCVSFNKTFSGWLNGE